jgi:hypothetical protein
MVPGWIGVQRGNGGACLHLAKPAGATNLFLVGFYSAGIEIGSSNITSARQRRILQHHLRQTPERVNPAKCQRA